MRVPTPAPGEGPDVPAALTTRARPVRANVLASDAETGASDEPDRLSDRWVGAGALTSIGCFLVAGLWAGSHGGEAAYVPMALSTWLAVPAGFVLSWFFGKRAADSRDHDRLGSFFAGIGMGSTVAWIILVVLGGLAGWAPPCDQDCGGGGD